MIIFSSENEFVLENRKVIGSWIEFTIHQEDKELGEINYIFCDDDYLVNINNKILKHNTLTDIISLDYSIDNIVSGDIYISTERVIENAVLFSNSFDNELHRVMVHGVLHYCGYRDKTIEEKNLIKSKEDYYLSLRTF